MITITIIIFTIVISNIISSPIIITTIITHHPPSFIIIVIVIVECCRCGGAVCCSCHFYLTSFDRLFQNVPKNTSTFTAIKTVIQVIVFPMIFWCSYALIPYQPPQPGFVNNWVCVIAHRAHSAPDISALCVSSYCFFQ